MRLDEGLELEHPLRMGWGDVGCTMLVPGPLVV